MCLIVMKIVTVHVFLTGFIIFMIGVIECIEMIFSKTLSWSSSGDTGEIAGVFGLEKHLRTWKLSRAAAV